MKTTVQYRLATIHQNQLYLCLFFMCYTCKQDTRTAACLGTLCALKKTVLNTALYVRTVMETVKKQHTSTCIMAASVLRINLFGIRLKPQIYKIYFYVLYKIKSALEKQRETHCAINNTTIIPR